jgi:hypothetical protein
MIEQMIWGEEPPSFDAIIGELEMLEDKIHTLPWKLNKEYPIPGKLNP